MNLQALPEEALKEILALTEAKKKLDIREKAENKFMSFAHYVYDNFIEGKHHRVIAEKLEKVARGEIKRLIIFRLLSVSLFLHFKLFILIVGLVYNKLNGLCLFRSFTN